MLCVDSATWQSAPVRPWPPFTSSASATATSEQTMSSWSTALRCALCSTQDRVVRVLHGAWCEMMVTLQKTECSILIW